MQVSLPRYYSKFRVPNEFIAAISAAQRVVRASSRVAMVDVVK